MTVLFPKWTNHLPTVAAVSGVLGLGLVVVVITYWFSPKHTDVGYAPDQPVAYSHKLHAGLLGFDCRYCHQKVEDGPHATVPPTETCLNFEHLCRCVSTTRLRPCSQPSSRSTRYSSARQPARYSGLYGTSALVS